MPALPFSRASAIAPRFRSPSNLKQRRPRRRSGAGPPFEASGARDGTSLLQPAAGGPLTLFGRLARSRSRRGRAGARPRSVRTRPFRFLPALFQSGPVRRHTLPFDQRVHHSGEPGTRRLQLPLLGQSPVPPLPALLGDHRRLLPLLPGLPGQASSAPNLAMVRQFDDASGVLPGAACGAGFLDTHAGVDVLRELLASVRAGVIAPDTTTGRARIRHTFLLGDLLSPGLGPALPGGLRLSLSHDVR